jgi:glycosyltransferase involved in cell wall biosynthesis
MRRLKEEYKQRTTNIIHNREDILINSHDCADFFELFMRIAYLGSKGLPSKGGTERVVEAIVSRLSGAHEITVYCDSRYTPKGTKVDGIHLIRIFTVKGKHIQATSLVILSALHALLSKYDVIHVQGVDSCFILPILRLKYRAVTTSHGTPGRLIRLKWGKIAWFLIRLMEYPFMYLSNYATSVSFLDAEYLKARYKRNVVYIPNGVDECVQYDLKLAGDKLRQIEFEPGNYLMFAAGRIDPTKGCHLVLEALSHIGNSLKLAIVGDLNQVPSYSDHLREFADGKPVVFIPPISDRKLLFGMVKLARLFIFPSTDEGMSMMLLEAASLQAPIVCSDIPENKFVMQDNVVYFHSGDALDLANQIQWAIDHPGEMSSMAQKASIWVKANLTWEKIVNQYEEIYKECKNADVPTH